MQKVEVLQGRVRKMGVVSDGTDDKAFTDEARGRTAVTSKFRTWRPPERCDRR